jgi:hypothetical protein
MNPVLSNFILTLIGVGVGAIISLVGAISKCMLKSRCSKIDCCCGAIECIREPLSGEEVEQIENQELKNKL